MINALKSQAQIRFGLQSLPSLTASATPEPSAPRRLSSEPAFSRSWPARASGNPTQVAGR